MKNILLLACTLFSIAIIGCENDSNTYEFLKNQSDNYNQNLPKTNAKGDVRMDSSYVIPKDTFVYLITYLKEISPKIPIENIKNKVEMLAKDAYKKSPGLEQFRKHKVTILNKYRDNRGRPLFDIYVTPEMYKKD
jgi:hypothetical protein